MDLNLLYREEMLEHVKHPKNMGVIENADYTSESINSSCGDKLKLYLKIDKGIVTEAKYIAEACAVSISSASILSEQIIGKSIKDVLKIKEKDILDNFYNSLTPSRTKCAFLVLNCLDDLKKYEEN